MNDKAQESIQYLKSCSTIENEAFRLYETLSKKVNQPESSQIIGLAYDSLKNTKIIGGILEFFDALDVETRNPKKNLSDLASETALLNRKISKINNLDYLQSVEILKELTTLEDTLGEAYKNYLQSNAPKNLVEEISKIVTLNQANFKKIFESLTEEKTSHRGTIVDLMYALEVKETETHRKITPIVKYQNPNAWNHESTIHAFTNTPQSVNPIET